MAAGDVYVVKTKRGAWLPGLATGPEQDILDDAGVDTGVNEVWLSVGNTDTTHKAFVVAADEGSTQVGEAYLNPDAIA